MPRGHGNSSTEHFQKWRYTGESDGRPLGRTGYANILHENGVANELLLQTRQDNSTSASLEPHFPPKGRRRIGEGCVVMNSPSCCSQLSTFEPNDGFLRNLVRQLYHWRSSQLPTFSFSAISNTNTAVIQTCDVASNSNCTELKALILCMGNDLLKRINFSNYNFCRT